MDNDRNRPPVGIVTGASRGLGRALATGLAKQGWQLVIDGRDPDALAEARWEMPGDVITVSGDATDPQHRNALVAAAAERGGPHLVVNNAGVLGPSPQPPLIDYPLADLRYVYEVNVMAPLALAQLTLPALRSYGGALVNISSDAAVEPYPGWGGYGSAKAALEQLSRVMAEEEPAVRVWVVDPGDLRTRMHQEAFPGEDISDRPLPETVVPAFLRLLAERPASGRIRLADLSTEHSA
ncbi:MAG TPA: SDR family oxidoreductase [Micromonosporaceae bacterium]|nr:SDR family oxidoreductase [Micromonosporaceae bacterium]